MQNSSQIIFYGVFRTVLGPEFIGGGSEYEEVTKMIFLTKRGLSELDPDFQFQLLNTLFQNLTKQKPSGRFGSHWEEIGFQGTIFCTIWSHEIST